MIFISSSPVPLPCVEGRPLPRIRSTLPGWVPGAILTRARPVIVGTSTEPPRAAVGMSSIRLYITSWPSRMSSGCLTSSITTRRSPLTPPRRAALPLPCTVNVIPSSTPAGIWNEIIESSFTTPSP